MPIFNFFLDETPGIFKIDGGYIEFRSTIRTELKVPNRMVLGCSLKPLESFVELTLIVGTEKKSKDFQFRVFDKKKAEEAKAALDAIQGFTESALLKELREKQETCSLFYRTFEIFVVKTRLLSESVFFDLYRDVFLRLHTHFRYYCDKQTLEFAEKRKALLALVSLSNNFCEYRETREELCKEPSSFFDKTTATLTRPVSVCSSEPLKRLPSATVELPLSELQRLSLDTFGAIPMPPLVAANETSAEGEAIAETLFAKSIVAADLASLEVTEQSSVNEREATQPFEKRAFERPVPRRALCTSTHLLASLSNIERVKSWVASSDDETPPSVATVSDKKLAAALLRRLEHRSGGSVDERTIQVVRKMAG